MSGIDDDYREPPEVARHRLKSARQPEASQQPDQESKREKQLGQDIYDEIFDAWLTKLVGDQSVQAHCQRLADKIMKHVGGYLQQPAREAAQPDGQSFDEWCASVKDCGYDVQPNSATARQRKLGWDAAIASMKRESVNHYIEALTPSAATKCAYAGEFQFSEERHAYEGAGNLESYTHRNSVPWVTIKEIMAAIKSRAENRALGDVLSEALATEQGSRE